MLIVTIKQQVNLERWLESELSKQSDPTCRLKVYSGALFVAHTVMLCTELHTSSSDCCGCEIIIIINFSYLQLHDYKIHTPFIQHPKLATQVTYCLIYFPPSTGNFQAVAFLIKNKNKVFFSLPAGCNHEDLGIIPFCAFALFLRGQCFVQGTWDKRLILTHRMV